MSRGFLADVLIWHGVQGYQKHHIYKFFILNSKWLDQSPPPHPFIN
jgi:hypothetical protein